MEWVRGKRIGQGSFGTVNLAIPRSQNSPVMAVKSCGASHSATLKNEKKILDELKDCPEIVGCYGDSYTLENGEKLYNVLLEYASGGSLADKIKNIGEGELRLMECEVKRYVKSILKGLYSIHKRGYVHCDIKLENILLFNGKNGRTVKIGDFGLARREGEGGGVLRGTPMYMSPEMVVGGEQGMAADIWALGCLVVEMVSGGPAWGERDFGGLMMRIGVGEEVPRLPGGLSAEGRDFLGKCFLKDPKERWTAEMLLRHRFVDVGEDFGTLILGQRKDVVTVSPKSVFDFPDWVSGWSCEITSLPLSPEFDFDWETVSGCGSESNSPVDRIHQLVTGDGRPDWSAEDSWVSVRS